jgi:transposase
MDGKGSGCSQCAESVQRIAVLERKLGRVLRKLGEAEARIQSLREQLASSKKDSGNSSKPPSSDVVKPPKRSSLRRRRRGAQKGHPRYERPPFGPGDIDFLKRHAPESCPQCGGPVEQLAAPGQVLVQVELVRKPTLVTEHRSGTCRCHACSQDFTQPIPREIAAAGTFGPRLTAYVAYLKGACHASYGTIQKLLRETCGLQIASGTLVRLCQKIAQSLQVSYDELRFQIPHQESLNVDETSHRENGRWQWTWAFRAPRFTLFHIDPTRSASVLERILGDDFSGTLGSDYYSAYRSYLSSHPQADAQFCLAHLVRDVKFLQSLPDAADQQFGQELLAELKELFRLWQTPEQFADQAKFRAALIAQGKQLERVATERAPDTRPSRRLARRFEKHAEHYLRFTHAPAVEPTNNAAEQAIRHVVIDRHVTQGTRSPRGSVWCQRIWTTIATCRQHGHDLLSFLEKSFLALLTDMPPPTLLPAPSTS